MPEWKSTTVPLAHPIKMDGGLSITEITLHEPDLDAMELLEEAGFEEGKRPTIKQVRKALEALSRQPADILGKMHKDDVATVSEAMIPLLGAPSDGAEGSDSTVN